MVSTRTGPCALALGTLLGLLAWGPRPAWADEASARPGVSAPPDLRSAGGAEPSFFARTNLSRFEVELSSANYEQLAQAPRKYVSGRVILDGRVFERVGIRLKGTGTFEPISKHPNLTLKFNWQLPEQDLCGITKLFLKNSRQDQSFLCELAASGAYADAGLAAPRITHARARLNGRDLGPCVVEEAVNKRLLKRQFGNARGNLYEGAFQDIGARLELDNGEPNDRADLRQLAAALMQSDLAERRKALARVLDVEQFLNFLAIELIIANWDGYAIHQNNYRVYHNPETDRIVFIPHGMDNTFFEAGLSLMPPPKSILAAALLANAEDREAFRQRVAKLIPVVFDPDRIRGRIACAVTKLKQGATSAEAQWLERNAALFNARVRDRLRHLTAELAGIHPQTPQFDASGAAHLEGWVPRPDWNESAVEPVVVSGTPCLSIVAAKDYCFGSWRLPLWLPPGPYRIEGVVRTSGVRGLPSRTGSGAGVRVLGTMRGGGVQGSSEWMPVQHQFVVAEGCEWVELIAELRAFQGTTLFDPKYFRLVRALR